MHDFGVRRGWKRVRGETERRRVGGSEGVGGQMECEESMHTGGE